MPQKICSVCVSYLKHACIFRQQAIDNVKSLKTAKELSDGTIVGSKIIDPPSTPTPPQQSNEKFFKSNMGVNAPGVGGFLQNSTNANVDFESVMKQQLDLFFGDNNFDEDDEDDDDDDDDENDDGEDEDDERAVLNGMSTAGGRAGAVKMAIHNFFNYTEKPFEEDDLTEGIGISEPDDHKERKCYACKRRFMLTESYDEHMKECVQTKLFSFITDCHQLAIIKKHKAISAQEFIRRMIFAVKGIVKALAMCYKDLSPAPTTIRLQQQHQTMNNSILNQPPPVQKNMPKKLFNVIDGTSGPPPKLTACPPMQVIRSHPIPAVPSPTTNVAAPRLNANFPKIPNFVAKCPQCKKRFDSIQALETHNQQHHNKTAIAPITLFNVLGTSQVSTSLIGGGDGSVVAAEPRNELLELLRSQDCANDGIIDVFRLHRKTPNLTYPFIN